MNLLLWLLCYETNSVDNLNPELWAQESLVQLENKMVVGNLLYRDYSDEIAEFGDTVNVDIPSAFSAKRKDDTDDVTVQNAVSTKIPVVLNQNWHVTFRIRDRQMSLAFKNLVEMFIVPAMSAVAQAVDLGAAVQMYQFLSNAYGRLEGLSSSNAVEYISGLGQVMKSNKAFTDQLYLGYGPKIEAKLIQNATFHEADKLGDGGEALKKAWLGEKLGFGCFMTQNMPELLSGTSYNDIAAGAVNNGGGYAAGVDTVVVDGFSAAIETGSYITIAGEMRPHRVVATIGGSTPTSIQFTPALAEGVANDAVVTNYQPGAVNLVAGYAAGWLKEIVVDGFTKFPRVGQGVAFTTDETSAVYGILAADEAAGTILLDRPLAAALSNDDTVNLLPAGNYGFGFHPKAVALVTRPLALPPKELAKSAVVNYNGFSVRVTITYEGLKQSVLVTVDILAGYKVLYNQLGAVLLG